MGDRGHIVLNYGDNRKIYLYTHWRGSQGVSDQIVRVLAAVGIEEDSAIKMCNAVALYEGD